MTNKELYNQLNIQQQLPLFFKTWWLDAVSNSWDVCIAQNDTAVTAVFPYHVDKRLGLTLIRNPKLTPYLGPYFLIKFENLAQKIDVEDKTFQTFWKQIPQYHYFKIETLPEFQNFSIFHNLKFKNSARLTYFIDLRQELPELFGNIQRRRRNYIKKAEEVLEIKKITNPDITEFISWHRYAFQQKGQKYPYDTAFIKKIIGVSEANQSSDFWIAKTKNGENAAMLWAPYDDNKMYHLISAFNPQLKINGAVDTLVWQAIKEAKSKNLKIYDFEGSMDSGIESFFRKFGGVRKIYFSFEHHRSWLWKIKMAILG